MLMLAGFLFIAIGLVMLYQMWRNARRPRQEVRINEVMLDYIRNDRKQLGPRQPHALVKYNYDGVNYESRVFLKVPDKSEGDWIEISINPSNPELADIYAPEKEKRAVLILFMIGAFLVAGSWWILDYFEAW